MRSRGLQPEPGFVAKVVGLLDVLPVRHCCFAIGPPGSGKTEAWRSFMEALRATGRDGLWGQVALTAVTSDELYGTMSKGQEWRDGAVAAIIRNMSKEMNGYRAGHFHKWAVLNGDIGATWVGSTNTVMDDNNFLTLVSNECIPLLLLSSDRGAFNARVCPCAPGGGYGRSERVILGSWKVYVCHCPRSAFGGRLPQE
mmetsp:Transcript_2746/g.9263  ORF Transcript_2746/g.9263 Transcript_2746/m.9263 type:complete len:198 (+) Transcript_2746:653-1246(+)